MDWFQFSSFPHSISDVLRGTDHHLFQFRIGVFEDFEKGGSFLGALATEGDAVSSGVLELHEVTGFAAVIGSAAMPCLVIE